jgi:hypothetical protein
MTSAQGVAQAPEPRPFQASVDRATAWCPLPPEDARAAYSVQVAATLEEIEVLRRAWINWANSLDTDIDYFLYRLAHDSGSPRPFVIAVFQQGIAQAMLLGQVKKRQVFTIVSSVRVPGPQANVLEIKKGGRLGPPSPAVDKLLAQELLKATRSGAVDSVCFERLPLQSELFRQIQHLPSFVIRERVPHVFCYSVLSLNAPDRKRSPLFSGKTQREIRRKERIVERQFPNQME